MKSNLALFVFLLMPFFSNAQRHDYSWIIGNYGSIPDPLYGGTLIDFNTVPLNISTVQNNMSFNATNFSICDVYGNLQFYTNGIFIADATHELVENGDSLNNYGITYQNSSSGVRIPQGAIGLPLPGSDSIYYMIHEPVDFGSNGLNTHVPLLYYSIVDIFQNNGLGKVLEKNILLVQDTLAWGKITACKHANGRDWWILIPELDASKNSVYKLILTPYGISNLGKYETGGSTYPIPSGGNAIFTPDGTKYIRHDIRFDPWNSIDIYNFDRCNGNLEHIDHFELNDTSFIYGGVAASPDSRFLYAVTNNIIYQFDLTAPNVEETKTVVANYDGFIGFFFGSTFGVPQLAPDGSILIAAAVTDTVMHVIRTPNQPGLASHVDQHAIHLPKINQKSIPNFPNYRLGPLDGSPCDTLGLDNHPLAGFTWWAQELAVTFSDNSFYRPESWAWDFGDGATSSERNPLHSYASPGEYQVCLTVSNEYAADTICHWVQVDTLVDVVGVVENNGGHQNGVSVQPNPATERVDIVLRQPMEKGEEWVLFDQLGREVTRAALSAGQQESRVSLDDVPPGLYFWSIGSEGGQRLEGKLIISK